jgi:hypothetical protein
MSKSAQLNNSKIQQVYSEQYHTRIIKQENLRPSSPKSLESQPEFTPINRESIFSYQIAGYRLSSRGKPQGTFSTSIRPFSDAEMP